jgi:probable HAF family extracellular repeat protein
MAPPKRPDMQRTQVTGDTPVQRERRQASTSRECILKFSFICSLGAAACAATLALAQPARAQSYTLTDLGSLGGTSVRAYDLNNHGQVVGWAEESLANAHRRAFFYDPVSGMRALGDTSWSDWRFDSFAGAINDAGQIAGGTGWGHLYPQTRQQAFVIDTNGVLTTGVGAPDPLLPGTGEGDTATDLSFFRGMTEDGRVWGNTWLNQGQDGNRYYLTGAAAAGMTLDTLPLHESLLNTINPLAANFDLSGLNAAGLLANGHWFIQAIDINERGQVLAWATDQRSYLVTPVPEPATWALMLAGLGALGATQRKRRANSASNS